MIIECPSCKKKFEINANLIPKEGRLLECSSCDHQWFYKDIDENKSEELHNLEEIKSSITLEEKKGNKKNIGNRNKDKNTKKNTTKHKNIKEKDSNKNIPFLNLILIFIITFISFLLIVETFKSPLKEFIPNIDFILNSLYEIFKDIYLFIKDLF
ncbi:zinc-ribbon domain-containing protein [Candidatus Pelagibacter sp.]|nr:zinc-ribbon domain-containing protein [Candidatus Pelagibacter sp.]